MCFVLAVTHKAAAGAEQKCMSEVQSLALLAKDIGARTLGTRIMKRVLDELPMDVSELVFPIVRDELDKYLEEVTIK